MDTLDPDMDLILAIRRLAYQFDDSKHYVKYRVLMRAADRLKFLRAEHNRVNRLAACGTVQNWLALSDEDKAKWFAVLIHESNRRKKAELRIEELQHSLDFFLYGGAAAASQVGHDGD